MDRKRILIIGDSIIKSMDKCLPDGLKPHIVSFRHFSGSTIEALMHQVQIIGGPFDWVLVHVGTNNISNLKESVPRILNKFDLLFQTIENCYPGVRVLVSGILPRDVNKFPPDDRNYKGYPADANEVSHLNSRIDEVNSNLPLLCSRRGNFFFYRSPEPIIGFDGLHLGSQGHGKLAGEFACELRRLIGENSNHPCTVELSMCTFPPLGPKTSSASLANCWRQPSAAIRVMKPPVHPPSALQPTARAQLAGTSAFSQSGKFPVPMPAKHFSSKLGVEPLASLSVRESSVTIPIVRQPTVAVQPLTADARMQPPAPKRAKPSTTVWNQNKPLASVLHGECSVPVMNVKEPAAGHSVEEFQLVQRRRRGKFIPSPPAAAAIISGHPVEDIHSGAQSVQPTGSVHHQNPYAQLAGTFAFSQIKESSVPIERQLAVDVQPLTADAPMQPPAPKRAKHSNTVRKEKILLASVRHRKCTVPVGDVKEPAAGHSEEPSRVVQLQGSDKDIRDAALPLQPSTKQCQEQSASPFMSDHSDVKGYTKPSAILAPEKSPNLHEKFLCNLCCKFFSTGSHLKRHQRNLHSEGQPNVSNKKYSCSVCQIGFTMLKNCKRHEKNIHKLHLLEPKDQLKEEKPLNSVKKHLCNFCEKQFTLLKNLKRHKKTVHKCEETKTKYQCSECSNECSSKKKFIDHLHKYHPDINFEKQVLHFQNHSKFLTWKKTKEKKTASSFLLKHKYNTKKCTIHSYECHRSGELKSKGKGKRHIKINGSIKIGKYCPARILYKLANDGSIQVEFISTHVGHQCEHGALRLTQDDKEGIAGQLLAGVPKQRILLNISEDVLDQSRLALTNMQDIRNVAASYGVNASEQRNKNDVLSVDSWVKEMKASDSSPILVYKLPGEISEDYPDLQEDDFILGFMNDAQIAIFESYGNEIVSIDSTHGTNSYGIQLTSIVVKDNNWEGFPVAFLWSNRQTEEVFRYFFSAIKDRLGNLNPKTHMSDDFPAFYNAWSTVFGPCQYRLLCDWHVKRAWAKNLSTGTHLVPDVEKRQKLLNMLYMIINEVDLITFQELLKRAAEEFSEDDHTKSFWDYFKNTYLHRTEQWAACKRIGANINTNMSIERWHKDLKYNSDLKGKCGTRLDKAIHSLMKSLKIKLMNRLSALSRGKLTKKHSNLRKSHKLAQEKIKEGIHIYQEDEKVWIVPSFTIDGQTYKVKWLPLEASHQCSLLCTLCNNICIHNMRCSCPESSIRYNFCKHIHVVGMKFDLRSQAVENLCTHGERNLEIIFNSQTENMLKEKCAIENELQKGTKDTLKAEAQQAVLGIMSAIENCSKNEEYKLIISSMKVLQANLQALTSINPMLPPAAKSQAANANIQPQRRFPDKKKKYQNKLKLKPQFSEKDILSVILKKGSSSGNI